jgi:esterase/lipase superfamily enzyme
MQDRLVHFATNRIFDAAKPEFGNVPTFPPGRLLAGTIRCVVDTDPAREGTAGPPFVAKQEDPDAGLLATLRGWLDAAASAQALPLLFTHGFNFKFHEAAARTAALCAWLEEGGAPKLMPFAFTWPSNGMGSIDAYKDDQKDAGASGIALARLIAALATLRPKTLPVYMAHSMGARATRFGMQAIGPMLDGLPKPVFAQAFVMAGDDVSDVLDHPWRALDTESSAGAMRPLAALARHVTIGVNRADGVVWMVSGTINQGRRLGAAGPAHPQDLPENVAVVDYSMVVAGADQKPVPQTEAEMNWIGHQYHRNDPAVRRDLVAALEHGGPPAEVPGRRPAGDNALPGQDEIAGRLYPKP